ncbi:hypothetical protein ASPBRDRAFT_125023, partial [Aspergillus brasiliensis CBS 101740]
EELPAMPEGNTIATVTVLLETSMILMTEPVIKIVLDPSAGLVPVTANCQSGKCKAVVFDNVPSFVFTLRSTSLDWRPSRKILYGGMIYGIVDATALLGSFCSSR